MGEILLWVVITSICRWRKGSSSSCLRGGSPAGAGMGLPSPLSNTTASVGLVQGNGLHRPCPSACPQEHQSWMSNMWPVWPIWQGMNQVQIPGCWTSTSKAQGSSKSSPQATQRPSGLPWVHPWIQLSPSSLCSVSALVSPPFPPHLDHSLQTNLGTLLEFFSFIKDIYFPITDSFLMKERERERENMKKHKEKQSQKFTYSFAS